MYSKLEKRWKEVVMSWFLDMCLEGQEKPWKTLIRIVSLGSDIQKWVLPNTK
jgi:hypothetical protein